MIDIEFLEAARRAFSCGNYNEARYLYQQIAYGYNQFTELEKEAFTKEVSIFAGSDPLYQQILQHIISHIKNTGALLLPNELIIKNGHLSVEQLADKFGVSIECAQTRINKLNKKSSY